MNILYYFKDYDNYMSKWQYVHIIDELQKVGHTIVVFNPLKYKTLDESNENLVPFIKKSTLKFDLFLNCEGDGFLYSETVKEVKTLGLPTVLICFDNLHAPFLHRKMALLFDVVWLTSFETRWMFEKWGCANIIFQPYAANPYNFKPNWSKPENSMCFIGSPYGSRISIFNTLTQGGIKLDVFADKLANHTQPKNNTPKVKVSPVVEILQALSFEIGRKVLFSALLNRFTYKDKSVLDMNQYLDIQPSVSFEEMQEKYSNYSLSLNITVLRNTYLLSHPLHKIHLRTFEIPMCGGLEIAPYSDELSGYFEDEKEIVLYRNEDEFISKAKFYINPKNDALCMEMKRNARKRAENEHTWNHRFNKIFKII